MSVLVLAEHDNASIKDATRVAVTAAGKLGGDVHVLVAGQGAQGAADAAAKIAGVSKVLLADDAAYANGLAENVAPLIEGLMANYDALVAPATTSAKNIAPRVAAKLDTQQISEITGIVDASTFERPIYAGNAIATVQSGDARPSKRPVTAARQASRRFPAAVTRVFPASSAPRSPSSSVRSSPLPRSSYRAAAR
jgi:electron transfer flavoprotein alpha subunit